MDSVFFLGSVFLLLQLCVPFNAAEAVSRSTAAGTIEGYTDSVIVDGTPMAITRFLGIPYAEPPIGNKRFTRPAPRPKFNDVFKASNGKVSCIQTSKEAAKRYTNVGAVYSEDCLTLNIYVPSNFSDGKGATSMPTMVWIYGGGFKEGSTAGYNPDVLSVTTDTVVVTINYRVGMFGFLQSSDGKFKGNQGLWDQHLAIKWVHENIGFFYGSTTVTLFGQSAGAASVLYQAMYPGNVGIISKIIAESGSSLAYWALRKSPNAEQYFKAVGCLTTDPTACLESKSYDELQISEEVIFTPVVDGEFITESPEAILYGNNLKSQAARDIFYSLDIMSGANRYDDAIQISTWSDLIKGIDLNDPHITRDQLKEFIYPRYLKYYLNSYKLDTDTLSLIKDLIEFVYTDWAEPDSFNATRFAAINFGNDIDFFWPSIRTVQSHSRSLRGTYFYEYCPKPTNSALWTPDWVPGANHGDEIQAIFGTPFQANTSKRYTQEEKDMSRAMMTMWSNFARTGDPNRPNDVTRYIHTTWPKYDMTSQKYLEISNQMSVNSVRSHFHAGRLQLWSDIIPGIINSFRSAPTTTTRKPFHIDLSGIIGK